MKELSKKALHKSREILLDFAETSVEGMKRTAKKYSKNDQLTDEQRERYATAADLLRDTEKRVSDYREGGRTEEESSPRYNNCYGEVKQKAEISPGNYFGGFEAGYWENRWIPMGKLSRFDNDDDIQLSEKIGLIKLKIDSRVVYIKRALHLKRGGINDGIKELLKELREGNTSFSRNLRDHYEDICIVILECGEDFEAKNICRDLELYFIERYKPDWQ